ncbi:conserved hypothetical protein [Nitrobacter winogradskyi Nb-255]|uniref:LTXXQ motif family protein n=1 Tax=Nitrobacter winogradskyi (strain ATCC 25391 / DSM 10237 / CIP 104748 / NCIMB 11846 / Nb-255) TaxID=323098 RepID=Q3SQ50_NITWN|nr:Spy/CpxP family protein refolding chaperone [Nitrobacter winogradskyi]ABA05591.1 conserved hypothetical protein [Nitrobacter winogradskyi Nb-255]
MKKKAILAGVAALAIAGSTAVYAHQHHPWSHQRVQLSPQDRTAIADARIAAVHAGLALTPDQEKLWPPVEQAIRDFAKLRIDRVNAKMQAKKEKKESKKDDAQKQQAAVDQVARLRAHADRMAETAAALKKIADAADPLYKTLDDGQKRRLMVLTRMNHSFGMGGWRHHHRFDRGGDRLDHSKDRDEDSGRL